MISRGGFEVLGDLGDQDFDLTEALAKVKLQAKSGEKESGNRRSLDSDQYQFPPEEKELEDGDDFQIVGGNKSGRTKAMLCRYFIQGTCMRGDACNFAHKVGQLSTTPRVDKGPTEKEIEESKHHPLYKTEMCRYYQNNSCHRGVDCCFAHSKAELRDRPRFEDFQVQPKIGNPLPFDQQKPFAPKGPDLEGRLEEIWQHLENCHKFLFFGKIDAARQCLGEVRIEQIGNTAALSPEVSMRASVLKARYQDLEKQISEGSNSHAPPQENPRPPNAGSQQIRKELLKIVERAAYAEDIERLRSCVYDITPPLTETELGSLLWRCVVDVCKFKTVQILVSQWRGSDWTKLTVDSGLEGRKCLIHELVLKALEVSTTSGSDAKGIISLMLQHRPRAVLDLYQGTTPLMLATKKRATLDLISLLAPATVPEALEVKCGVPPRNAIEEAQHLSQAVGISDIARKQYQNIYSFLVAKRDEGKALAR